MVDTLRLTPKVINEILADLQKEMTSSRTRLRRESLTDFAERHGRLNYEQLKEMLYSLADAADRIPLNSVPSSRETRVKLLREKMDSGEIDRRKVAEITDIFLAHNLTLDIERLNQEFKPDSVVRGYQRQVANNINALAMARVEFGVPRTRAYADAWRFVGQVIHRNIRESLKDSTVTRNMVMKNLSTIWEIARDRSQASRLYGEFAIDYKRELDSLGVVKRVDWSKVDSKIMQPKVDELLTLIASTKLQKKSRGGIPMDAEGIRKALLSHRKTIMRRYQPAKPRGNIPINLKRGLREFTESLSEKEKQEISSGSMREKMVKWGSMLQRADLFYDESKQKERRLLHPKLQPIRSLKRGR